MRRDQPNRVMPTGGGAFASGTNYLILRSVVINEDMNVVVVERTDDIKINSAFSSHCCVLLLFEDHREMLFVRQLEVKDCRYAS
jgi:hypothetical protein